MSSANPSVAMDVDGPQVPSNGPSTLKRSSSAPMINEGTTSVTQMAVNNSSNTIAREPAFNIFGISQHRARRFSASYGVVPGSPPVSSALRRIHQLRQEEDLNNLRELAHEREVHHAMQISQSWEDLTLMGGESHSNETKTFKLSSLQVQLPSCGGNMSLSSPPPKRLSSPNFPSPTRTPKNFIRRSASPVLRPSPLGVKRKLDDDKQDASLYPAPKRVYNCYSNVERGILTTSSLPGSLSSVGTPESISSADSPNFSFRGMDSPSPNRPMPSEPMVVSKSDDRINDNSS